MSSFEVVRARFTDAGVGEAALKEPKLTNWPVVYTIDNRREVYVGETLNASARMAQHLQRADRQELEQLRVVVDPEFNKSACLDLESHLIQLFAGEGRMTVLNRNSGIVDANYFRRDEYRAKFDDIFEELRREGLFELTRAEIVNSDLFKYSPFKALNEGQAAALENIVESLIASLEQDAATTIVVQGDPGTGKTIIAIYLMKLIADIAAWRDVDAGDEGSVFSDFFLEGNRERFQGVRVGLVVPQQSLRATLKTVFKKTPGLTESMVMDPYQAASVEDRFDVLIVDEAHRLSQRSTQGSGVRNAQYSRITENLFGSDDLTKTQLDWIREVSAHQILLVDAEQAIRPGDLPRETLSALTRQAKRENRWFGLHSQMRVSAGDDYVGYIRSIFSNEHPDPTPQAFGEYRLEFFDDAGEMHDEILRLNETHELSRLLAGYGWKWVSKNDKSKFDIEIDGRAWKWNVADKDWVASNTSPYEVGSIHVIQGYDLNYAGVIVGPELRFDTARERMVLDRSRYFDQRGKQNNRQLGITYSDDDVLEYVLNIYGVLLTRGIRGTFVYVTDPELREHLRPFFSFGGSTRYVPESGLPQ